MTRAWCHSPATRCRSYEGVIPRHKAVEADAGAFDVSHMGEIHVDGPTAQAFLQSVLSNDVDKLSDGDAQYTLLTNETGGIVDDLIAYRLGHGRFYLVNASNRAGVYAWLKEREPRGCEVRDASDEYGLIAVQGPHALSSGSVCAMLRRSRTRWASSVSIEVMVARTGYTGEQGVRLCCGEDDVVALWDAIVQRGVTPCGLGARDTLRLEVCYRSHGNDITSETDAISAGLGWACALDTDFTGVEVLRRIKEQGPVHQARPVRHGGARRSARGMQIDGGGEVTSNALADARRRDRHGLRADRLRSARLRARDRRPGKAATRTGRQEADLPEGAVVPAAETCGRPSLPTPSTTGRASRETSRSSE